MIIPVCYLESFANIYSEVADAICAARDGSDLSGSVLFPTGADGLHGVRFVEAAVKSNSEGAKWVSL